MERLQVALQKAREMRQGGLSDRARRPPSPNRPAEDHLNEAWAALPKLKLPADVLRRNLIADQTDRTITAPFDLLRTRLIQLVQENNWHRIAVVSAVASEGKSLVTLNLAFALARQADLRTAVYDVDLRRPSLAKKIGLEPVGSLPDVIRQKRDFTEHALCYGNNLLLLLNSEVEPNASELLQSRTMAELLEAIEDAYRPDIELFDMPPMSAVDDAHGFLRQVDAAIIVMAAESTSIKQLDVAERQVAALTKVAGVVLNKCNFTDEVYGIDYTYY